jgi:hypothetical protein
MVIAWQRVEDQGWFGTWFPAEPFCIGLGVIGV